MPDVYVAVESKALHDGTPQVLQELSMQCKSLWNQRISHLQEEPMQLYHKYRQSDHNREDSVNEKDIYCLQQ